MDIIVIGAGPAGCEAAHCLAEAGWEVEVVEKEASSGGNLANWHRLFPDGKRARELGGMLAERLRHPQIHLRMGVEACQAVRLADGRFQVSLDEGSRLEAPALLLATGFRVFDARRKEEYGYGIYANVMTSVELENLLANGSVLTSTGRPPRRVGFIHCVGSRDEKICNLYCSRLCCMTAVKQAVELRAILPEAEIFCFYMDMRMYGPGYEELYREAQEKHDIRFVRGRLSEASEDLEGRVIIKAEDTLIGRPLRMSLDLMVLMVGMEASDGSRNLAAQLGLGRAPNGFIQVLDPHYGTNRTAVEGVFVTGCSTSPMNLTDTLTDARSAAATISEYLKRNGGKTQEP